VRIFILFAIALLFTSCRHAPGPPQASSTPGPCIVSPVPVVAHIPEPETRVEMVNVVIHLDPQLKLHIRRLYGKFLPTKKGTPPSFDDKNSYILDIDSAVIAVSAASMAYAMNAYVFAGPNAPLRNLRLTTEGGQIRQEGTLRKGPGIPFEMVGDIGATPDGKIRIHPVKMRVGPIPVKGLMKLFGLDMAKLINARHAQGITVDDNDIILDPAQMLPPPKMRGRVTSVSVEGDEIVQIFGVAPSDSRAKPPTSNYMAYRGGLLQFGKLAMHDTDMRLIDEDPRDPFDFFPDHYQEQLVAGYSKTTATGGLLVYMPDYDKVANQLKR
jgi:hypothetical protein